MLSTVLPPATEPAKVVAQLYEPATPVGWPDYCVPNFSDWRKGDIVLVHSPGGPIGLAIQASQSASFSRVTRSGAICTHAGIYVGDGMIVDAKFGVGITETSVWEYCKYRSLQVRRISDPTISASNIDDIAVMAKSHIGEPYSVIGAIVSKLYPGTVPTPNALYCSTLVGLVVADATGVDLSSDPAHQPLHPGTLAGHPLLTDVLLEWRLK